MIIKKEILEGLRTSIKSEFAKRLEEQEQDTANIVATIITSSSSSNTYGWLEKFPQMREFVGERVLQSITESGYALANKTYESTLEVKRTDIEDDNLGIYPTISRGMADEVTSFKNRNIATIMKNGFSSLCYDGQNFFDTDHPVNKKTDGKGEFEPVSNIFGDIAKTGEPWYLLSLSGVLKPFILQQRLEPTMEQITDEKDYGVFMYDKYFYGVRWRGNFGYGFWQQAVASKEPLTAENYNAARKQMQRFKRDGGDPMGIMPTHLVVSVENEDVARQIIEAQIVNGDSNIYYNTTKLIVSPWL